MQVKKKRKRRYAATVGGVFIIFALIGVITLVVVSINLTGMVLDNTREREKLENILRPVLMFDPVPFESPQNIPNDRLLLYSMWAALGAERDEPYEFDDNAELIVPASDLELHAARLFGPDITLRHGTFGANVQTTYYYDAERNIYNVPVEGQLYVYSPQVETIERAESESGVYNVRVGYVPPTTAWTTDFSGNKGRPAPEKYMIYVMRRLRGGSYQILALRDTEDNRFAANEPQMQQSTEETLAAPENSQ